MWCAGGSAASSRLAKASPNAPATSAITSRIDTALDSTGTASLVWAQLRQDLKRLSPARAAELRERLTALLAEFDFDKNDESDGVPFGLLIALYPVTDTRIDRTAEPAEEPSDD